LALVVASEEDIHVNQFLIKLNFIVMIIGVSCKSSDQLKAIHVANVVHFLQWWA